MVVSVYSTLVTLGILYLGRRKSIYASWGFWLVVASIHRFRRSTRPERGRYSDGGKFDDG